MNDHKLKKAFGYTTGFVFTIGVMFYIYLLIIDHLEKTVRSTEETVWIYCFLAILLVGFAISYYSINCSIICEEKKINSPSFGGFMGRPKKYAFGRADKSFGKLYNGYAV